MVGVITQGAGLLHGAIVARVRVPLPLRGPCRGRAGSQRASGAPQAPPAGARRRTGRARFRRECRPARVQGVREPSSKAGRRHVRRRLVVGLLTCACFRRSAVRRRPPPRALRPHRVGRACGSRGGGRARPRPRPPLAHAWAGQGRAGGSGRGTSAGAACRRGARRAGGPSGPPGPPDRGPRRRAREAGQAAVGTPAALRRVRPGVVVRCDPDQDQSPRPRRRRSPPATPVPHAARSTGTAHRPLIGPDRVGPAGAAQVRPSGGRASHPKRR